MREFRIKVNNEKTYVVKAKDYNQAVKTLHSKLRDFDLTNFLALKRSLELRIGEEIDFDKLEEYVNKLPKDKNGKKNVDVKEVIKCCIKAKDNAVNDSISKYNGEDAIKTNGFVKIKEDGDWTSYKYNGSDFDDAVFKIHQYNPSLIAFISNGNKTITVRNKYLNDTDNTAQGEIEVLKSFGFDYKDGRWVKESNNNTIIAQPDYHYVSVIGPGDTEKHCKKYQYQSAGMLKKIITSNIKDSSIKDAGEEIRYLEGMKFNGIPYTGWAVQHWTDGYYTFDGKKPYIPSGGRDALLSIFKQGGFIGQWKGIKPDKGFESYFRHSTAVPAKDKLIESGSKEALSKNIATEIKAGKDPKQAAAIAYSVQRENDSSIKDVDWDFAQKLKKHSEEEIIDALKYSSPKMYKEYKNGGIQFAKLAGQLSSPEKEKVLKRLGDSYMKDADPVKVEKIIRKEKSALGITYYLFQTKSNSGATIYYEVTDKTYHGEPTYSGGGVISFSLKTANDSLDSHLLSDKLKAKYGEKEGTKRYLRGENDSAIKDSNNIKNRKSYTIKVGDKQYKVFAESESEAINKYIKSKKQ